MAESDAKSKFPSDVANGRRDLVLVLMLLLLTGGLRLWLLTHTEVAARDSVGFIRIALTFEVKPWAEVVRDNHQHPLYPVTVLIASWPVRFLQGGAAPTPEAMRLSAQIASGLAALMLVIPMYFLGKRLFSASVGFWTALLFQALPVSGHILSDGLSESLFLLLTTTTLLLASQALDRGSPWRFGLCGLCCGLTYLTRPEGGLLVLAVLITLFVLQSRSEWRLAWPAFGARTALLLLGAGLAGSPYVLATGRLTNKPGPNKMIGAEAAAVGVAQGGPLLAVMLPTDGSLPQRLWNGLWGLGLEFVRGFHYVAWLPCLVGAWWYRSRVWVVPGVLAMVVLSILHGLVLWRLAVVVGYMSDRHILIIVLCGLYPAVALLHEIPPRLMALLREGWRTALSMNSWPLFQRSSMASVVLLLALAGMALPRTLQPLHGNRAGHHAAGRWLAGQCQPGDHVDDDHCWAHYYAGCVFREQPLAKNNLVPEPQAVPTRYVVISRKADKESPARASRVESEEKLRAVGGQVVYHWPTNRDVQRAEVVVFAVRPSPGNKQ